MNKKRAPGAKWAAVIVKEEKERLTFRVTAGGAKVGTQSTAKSNKTLLFVKSFLWREKKPLSEHFSAAGFSLSTPPFRSSLEKRGKILSINN